MNVGICDSAYESEPIVFNEFCSIRLRYDDSRATRLFVCRNPLSFFRSGKAVRHGQKPLREVQIEEFGGRWSRAKKLSSRDPSGGVNADGIIAGRLHGVVMLRSRPEVLVSEINAR